MISQTPEAMSNIEPTKLPIIQSAKLFMRATSPR
jgi:hypothetical protein